MMEVYYEQENFSDVFFSKRRNCESCLETGEVWEEQMIN